MGRAGRPRFRPAICAYSFRNQLKAGTMTYADIIRMAADTGADGIDLTAYWLPDTNDARCLRCKKQAYRVERLDLHDRGPRAAGAADGRAAGRRNRDRRKWLDAADQLGASHIRIFGGAVPKGATEDQAVAWAVETLKRAAEEAGKTGHHPGR